MNKANPIGSNRVTMCLGKHCVNGCSGVDSLSDSTCNLTYTNTIGVIVYLNIQLTFVSVS